MPSLKDKVKSTFCTLGKNFNVVHINAQSVPCHYSDLLSCFEENKNVHAILISESLLKPSLPSSLFTLPGYRLIRNDRGYKRDATSSSSRLVGGGGVAVYLRSDLPCRVVEQSLSVANSSEHLFVEVTLHHTKVLLGVFYSPNMHINYFNSLEATLSNLRPQYKHIVLMGDFNTCLLKSDHRSKRLISLTDSLDLNILPMAATHFPHNGPPSLLDLIITTSTELVATHGQMNAAAFSAHDLIYASFKIRPPKRRHKTILIRNYGKIDREAFMSDLAEADWESISEGNDVDSKVAAFQTLILSLYDKHAPLREVRVRHYPAPWLTPEIKSLMTRRDAARVRMRHSPCEESINTYHELRKICNKMCRNSKRQHIHTSIEDCPSHKLWKFLKTIGVGKAREDTFQSLDLDALNNFFGTSPVCVAADVKMRTLKELADAPLSAPLPLDLGHVTENEVVKILKSIKTKAVGEDGLSLDMIIPFCDTLAPAITHILNCSISTGTFPTAWKYAHVIPLPKKSNANAFSEFRPISILPLLSKVLEHYVHRRLTKHLNHYLLFNKFQSGFRAGHSTTSALVQVTDDIRFNMEEGKITVLVLLDFSSAFNTVDSDILLAVLHKLNLAPETAAWFHSYLSDRYQRVKVNDRLSDWCRIGAGVPQGGVLSPLLFSVFIDEITSCLASSYHLYADDLQVYTAESPDSLTQAVDRINRDLATIDSWAKRHGLLLNAAKSQAIIIGSHQRIARLHLADVPEVTLNNNPIPYSSRVKNLGILMEQTLAWTDQVSEFSRRLYASLHSLKRLQNFLPIYTKIMLAQALLLPLLDYGDVAFLDLSQELLNRMERLQNQCIRFVFGLRKFDHVSEFRERLGWLPIRQRRDLHILSLLYNVLNNPNAPIYLRERFELCTVEAGSRLRSYGDLSLRISVCSSKMYAESFTVRAARLWNQIPSDVRKSKNVLGFKTNIKKVWGFGSDNSDNL
ncbi:hypothetical protein O0L34_g6624 [Tuta absoluta]|nr:hypothetical protein O0L34_g6624 [Tuta absoluta]